MFGWARSLFGFGRGTTAATHTVRARYDNAITHSENARQWSMADYLSAKSANSFSVRRVLRTRSRYEVSNNPYLFGVVNGNAADLIDSGPTLQVLTADSHYNRTVERCWAAWCAEVAFVEKLRTSKIAKSVDGEGFLIFKTVADLDHPVKLYPLDVEADQITTYSPANLAELWVDGLELHPVTGRPTHYHVLRSHPGDFFFPGLNPLQTDRIKARYVVHWFNKWRPGQVRGVPVFTPSLDLFAELRAYRRAVLGAAEVAADLAVVLEQDPLVGAGADTDDEGYRPFERVPFNRKMMTMLPPGVKGHQFDAKQPTTTYGDFQEKCLGEALRPLAYPLNLALGTSQKFNFSSSKLDHVNYRNSLSVEREDCTRVVLHKTFREWHAEAVLCGAIPFPPAGTLETPLHEWHWPGFESLDPAVDAAADGTRLAGGMETLREFWAKRGHDWRDVLRQLHEEKAEVERLGLTFGDVVKRSVSETAEEPEEAANAV